LAQGQGLSTVTKNARGPKGEKRPGLERSIDPPDLI
jgi:hypothetical protein